MKHAQLAMLACIARNDQAPSKSAILAELRDLDARCQSPSCSSPFDSAMSP